jgi:signal transduction histidine kinase
LRGAEASLRELAEALLRQTENPTQAAGLRVEAVSLGSVVNLAVSRVCGQLGPGRRDWRLAPDLDDMEILADRRALYEILLRVLTSAALATGEGDCIHVSAAQPDGALELLIQDEGVGLAVDKSGGAGRETRGLGVGLALAHSLMQAHGGALCLTSTAGVGTRARLSFPAAHGSTPA